MNTTYLTVLLGTLFLLGLYLWRLNRMLHSTPDEARKLCQPPWTEDDIRKAYKKAQSQPVNVRPFLFSRTNRRYIVVGGSGLVGAWIVQHLLMRGEDPAAIRIIDLTPPKREEILEKNVHYVRTDITDTTNVLESFQKAWPERVKSLPLTVFHCAAYISVAERTMELSFLFEKINIQGTSNIVKASQAVGASILVFTSSGSTSLAPPSYWPWPWQSTLKNFWQFLPNADRDPLVRPLNEYPSCYPWSKARAENLVRKANNPSSNFLTGALRPGSTLYGPGGANKFSLTYNYLSRGGSPSWIHHIVVNLVHAENVSIGHLAFEHALLDPEKSKNVSGKAYALTDPNPAITFGDLYRLLSTLAHPLTPAKFPEVPTLPILLLSYVIEAYVLLRVRVPFLGSILPEITGDLRVIQPAMLKICQVHTVFTDDKAQKEIGYRAPYNTLDGTAAAILDWNEQVEREAKEKTEMGRKEEEVGGNMVANNGVPVGPAME